MEAYIGETTVPRIISSHVGSDLPSVHFFLAPHLLPTRLHLKSTGTTPCVTYYCTFAVIAQLPGSAKTCGAQPRVEIPCSSEDLAEYLNCGGEGETRSQQFPGSLVLFCLLLWCWRRSRTT